MDGKTKPNEFYTIDHNNNTSSEDNAENYDEAMNDTKGWGENGTITKLINIATTIDEPTTTRANVNGEEQLPKYYVEEPTSLGNLENIGTKGNLDYAVDLSQPTHVIEKELLHFKRARAPLCCPSHIYLQGKQVTKSH
jgi:hypothetical protein